MSRSLSQPDPQLKTDQSSQSSGSRIPPAGSGRLLRTSLLVAGDALSFLTFAALGVHSHSKQDSIVWTAVPFAAGWFLVSPWLGVFRRSLTSGLGRMLKRTEVAWLVAWPVALVLRWALSADHQVPLSFALVILLANGVFLGIWRSLFATIEGWSQGRG